jgi:hypothetical protein
MHPDDLDDLVAALMPVVFGPVPLCQSAPRPLRRCDWGFVHPLIETQGHDFAPPAPSPRR